jgi:hypothetical protein
MVSISNLLLIHIIFIFRRIPEDKSTDVCRFFLQDEKITDTYDGQLLSGEACLDGYGRRVKPD